MKIAHVIRHSFVFLLWEWVRLCSRAGTMALVDFVDWLALCKP